VGLRFGRTWLRGFDHHPRCALTAVCDLRQDKLAQDEELADLVLKTTDFEEVVGCAAVDAVGVFTPAPLHAEQTAALLRAGKHVLCAVPAAVTVAGCRQVLDAVRESGRVYMMAENWPYEPSIRKARELYHAGRLGQIYYGEAEYVHHLESLWFDADGAPTWRQTFPALHYPTHGTGPYLHLTGDRFVEATGFAASGRRPPGADPKRDWLQAAMFRSERDCLFKLMNSFCNVHPGGHYFSFYGDRGSFETARGHEARTVATYWPASEGAKSMQREQCAHPPMPAHVQGMGAHAGTSTCIIDDFVKAVLDGASPAIDVNLALDMTLPGICAVESIARRETVPIPDPRTW